MMDRTFELFEVRVKRDPALTPGASVRLKATPEIQIEFAPAFAGVSAKELPKKGRFWRWLLLLSSLISLS